MFSLNKVHINCNSVFFSVLQEFGQPFLKFHVDPRFSCIPPNLFEETSQA